VNRREWVVGRSVGRSVQFVSVWSFVSSSTGASDASVVVDIARRATARSRAKWFVGRGGARVERRGGNDGCRR